MIEPEVQALTIELEFANLVFDVHSGGYVLLDRRFFLDVYSLYTRCSS